MRRPSWESRVRRLELMRPPNPETYVLTIQSALLEGGAVHYLMARDGTSKGCYVRMLSRDEVEQLEAATHG